MPDQETPNEPIARRTLIPFTASELAFLCQRITPALAVASANLPTVAPEYEAHARRERDAIRDLLERIERAKRDALGGREVIGSVGNEPPGGTHKAGEGGAR